MSRDVTTDADENPTAPLPWATDRTVMPLQDLQGDLGERVKGLGARQVNLYRA
ncbi:MAG: hypothetical protein QOC98_2942, partial [Frankiaceae bacterium]|nr:hypothetical protein [Frankiaceae bacterium]